MLLCPSMELTVSMGTPLERNTVVAAVWRTYFDEHEWININRQKTGVVSNIRMLDIAKRIIDKYRGLCGDGRIFPVPHYNTCLAGIRAVAKRCGRG